MAILLAEMRSPQEIADIIGEEFDVAMDRREILSFSKGVKWRKVISFLKKRFLAELSKIPIANKAVRLKYLQNVYKEALTESLKSQSQWGEVYELKLGAAIGAIQTAREEIEGNKPLIDNSQHTHYHLGERLKESREKANAGKNRIKAVV